MARLEFRDVDLKTPLLALTLGHTGVFKGTAEASEHNSDTIRRVQFGLYVETMAAGFG